MKRWATFDCYGTLIDWNGGVGDQLARLWGEERRAALLARYHVEEPRIQGAPGGGALPYREVLRRSLVAIAAAEGLQLPPGEDTAFGDSLPSWRAFPEVPAALREARERGWKLAILSNTDRDFLEASVATIGVPFDELVIASEIGSYKPAHGHWHAFFERTGADRAAHVHVGASLFHDAVPARQLGLPMVWINREAETAGPDAAPSRELTSLAGLADALDALVPPAAAGAGARP